MISSSKASVTPEPELARLTLVSSSKEEHLRRQSILSSLRPSLGDITGSPIIGPIGPPGPLSIEQQDTEMGESEALDTASAKVAKADLDGDTASDITLVDDQAVEDVDDDVMILDGVEKGIQEKILENKENIPPTKPLYRESSPEAQLMPLGEASSSRVNEQLGSMPSVAEAEGDSTSTAAANQMPLKDIEDEVDTNEISTAMAPPSRPPPVPPRPKPTESNAVQEAEYGAQQDVTEVIANVLFQLQCAIKAESVDDSGEQIDQVKRLFFGKQKSYTTNNQGTIRTKEEYMSDIKVDVASGSRDIYAALDGAYDVQDVEVGGYLEPQYTSISQLPPILQIMVQRVQFDPEKRSVFKSNHHLELKETIYLDRYMDSSDADLLQRRRECWEWKKQLLIMEKRMAQLVNSEVRFTDCLRTSCSSHIFTDRDGYAGNSRSHTWILVSTSRYRR